MNAPSPALKIAERLLADDDPPVAHLINPNGRSPWVLTCDHASNRLPSALKPFSPGDAAMDSHIAWDIGALEVAKRLSALLDAPLAHTGYSRLVVDCNRAPHQPGFLVTSSDGVEIEFNRDLHEHVREHRRREFFEPYHASIRELLDTRADNNHPTALLCLHSFTPVMNGIARPWHAGTGDRHHRNTSTLLRTTLMSESGLHIGDNLPYQVSEETDYGVLVHGEARGIPHALLEIRQDEINHNAGADAWARRLARALLEISPELTRD